MTILSYGEIDLDIYLSLDRLPTMEHSANVRDEFENVGGAAANTAIWLANWGVPTRLAGHDLGDDRTGESVRQLFAAHGHLDTSFIRWHRDYVSPRCQCLVTPDGERSFIMHWLEDLRINPASAEMMEGIAWLNLDMSGPAAPRLQASQLAKSLGVPVLVNDIYRIDHPILPLVDVLVISAAIAGHKSPDSTPLQLALQLQDHGDCAVIITDAAAPATILCRDGRQSQITPPTISPVDTTGAGDTFKAGLLHGLRKGMPLEEAARWGCAAASLMSKSPGTTRHLADLQEVQAWLPA